MIALNDRASRNVDALTHVYDVTKMNTRVEMFNFDMITWYKRNVYLCLMVKLFARKQS